ncbi:MAG: UDP-2,3-diacylglucosamine diphosphatase [Oligoflexia bacterium]|nr:UDP-2,3-diacylglucosamine diphosphatase [Oligoflexia bacterium]
MSMTIISDIHIKENNDEAYKLLIKFLKHKKTIEAKEIFLLGDIFEFMCGQRSEYYKKFSEYFDSVVHMIKNGKKIYYIEGNHDFHLKNLYENYFKLNNISNDDISNFKVYSKSIVLERSGKKYMFAHGDNIFFGGLFYPMYKKIILSFPVKKIMEVIPEDTFDTLGDVASSFSKSVRKKKNIDYSIIRDKFRKKIAKLAYKKKYDVIVLGHVHVQDNCIITIKNFESHYLNNGYALETYSFIHIADDGGIEFARL